MNALPLKEIHRIALHDECIGITPTCGIGI